MNRDRHIRMTLLLQKRRIVTIWELAQHFRVSIRTIYRDIKVLSAAGVPAVVRGSDILMLDDFTSNITQPSKQEDSSIVLEILQSTHKNTQEKDWVEVDLSHWGSDPNDQVKFKVIKHAVVNRRVIIFDYIVENDDGGQHEVEPLKLYYKGVSWYLAAYCRRRNSFHLFHLSLIKNLIVTSENFVPKLQEDWEIDALDNEPPGTLLKLRFNEKVLSRLYDEFDNKFILRRENGTLEVDISLHENERLYGYILSYGSDVEVLEPPYIRNVIIDRLKQITKIYENSI